MNKNSVLAKIMLVILAASFIGVFFVMSIMDLTNKKDIRDVSLGYAAQILVVEHSINGIIPTGKSYYYIGITEDGEKAYLVQAGKKWLEENFDSEGRSLQTSGLEIKGLEKKANDYKTENELASRAAQIEGISLDTSPGRVIMLNYKRDAIIKLVAGVLGLLVLAGGFLISRQKDVIPLWARRVYLVVFVLCLVFMLKAIL